MLAESQKQAAVILTEALAMGAIFVGGREEREQAAPQSAFPAIQHMVGSCTPICVRPSADPGPPHGDHIL